MKGAKKYRKLRYKPAETARRGSLGLWMAYRGAKLGAEAFQRCPGASGALRTTLRKDLLGSFEDMFQPSEVATWMMLTQACAVLGALQASEILGTGESPVHEMLDGRRKPSLAVKRSIWFIWSLLFCPEQLRDTFHIRTYGAFLDPLPDLEVKRFEADRILKGYARAEFSEVLTAETCTSFEDCQTKGGAIHYFTSSNTYASKVEPQIGTVQIPCSKYVGKDWPGIFKAHDSGVGYWDVGRMFNTSGDYVSKTNLLRVKYQLMLMPVVLTEVDLTDEDLAEIRRVAS